MNTQQDLKLQAPAVCPEHLLRAGPPRTSSQTSLTASVGGPLLHPPDITGKLREVKQLSHHRIRRRRLTPEDTASGKGTMQGVLKLNH